MMKAFVSSFVLFVLLLSCSPSYSQEPFSDADWVAALQKAIQFVSNLNLTEKSNIVTGVGWEKGPCVGNTPAITRLNYTGLCLHDSPTGLRGLDNASAFPAAINVATTWNRTLINEHSKAMGEEFRGKGVNVALTPMMNMLRVPQAGRNWEGYGADPYLQGEAAYQSILGIQSQGVIACAKHWVANEQEHFRTSGSSDIDERTLHEVYGWPFMKSVQAGVASVMCAYNLVNSTYACENDHTLNQVLKGEYGFRGFILSDWSATMSGAKSVNAGLDMTMPGDVTFNSGTTYFGKNLVTAVVNGTVPSWRLDDMAVRVMTGYYLLKQDQNFPPVNFNYFTPSKAQKVDVQEEHYKVIRKVGADSNVLLKNTANDLPFANGTTTATYNYTITTNYTDENNVTWTNVTVVTATKYDYAIIGVDAGPTPGGPNACPDQGCNKGTLAQGWGSGTSKFPYLVTPLDGITTRAAVYNQTIISSLNDTDLVRAKAAAAAAEIAIVCANADSGEAYITVEGNQGDRNNLNLWHQGDALITAVASVNPRTVVVLHVVGPVLMPWINNPNVTAVVLAGLPGQESGNALADVLFGDVNPSGKLVYTIGKSAADYPAQLVLYKTQLPIIYKEGLFLDYRWFDAKNITPVFPFGFGLSYTTFDYSNLRIVRVSPYGSNDDIRNQLIGKLPGAKAKPDIILEKNKETVLYRITVDITNNGTIDGEEVVQLYISFPPSSNSPPKVLRGFEKLALEAGETAQAVFNLKDIEISAYNAAVKGWVIPSGNFDVLIGASSRDIRLRGNFMR